MCRRSRVVFLVLISLFVGIEMQTVEAQLFRNRGNNSRADVRTNRSQCPNPAYRTQNNQRYYYQAPAYSRTDAATAQRRVAPGQYFYRLTTNGTYQLYRLMPQSAQANQRTNCPNPQQAQAAAANAVAPSVDPQTFPAQQQATAQADSTPASSNQSANQVQPATFESPAAQNPSNNISQATPTDQATDAGGPEVGSIELAAPEEGAAGQASGNETTPALDSPTNPRSILDLGN